MKGNVMLKDKLRAIVNHPAAGLVTALAINAGIVVTSVIVARKMDKRNEENTEA